MAFARTLLLAAACLAAGVSSVSSAPIAAGAVLIRQPGSGDAAPIDGVATLRIFARAGERVRQASLDASSGNAAFDAAALRAVRRWRYVPALTGDSREPEWLLVRLVYGPAPAARLVRAALR